jgi:RNA recognition motif-containing protein
LIAEVKLYVGNLSWGTEESALRELFGEYGQHRGFAFVTMDPADAQRAADETDGYELDGRILRVNESQPKGSGRQYNNNNSYNDGYGGGDGGDGSWGGNDN